MRYLLTVNRSHRGKLPKDATPGTWARYNDAFETVELTPAEIAAEIRSGYAIAAVHDGRRKRTNWRCAQHIGIDLDDGTLSWDELVHMPMVEHGAAIVHTTASHNQAHPRYRVLFLLEDPIEDADEYTRIVGAMLRCFETADPLCKDASRLFFGAPDCSLLLQPDNRLTLEDLANLATAYPETDDGQKIAQFHAPGRGDDAPPARTIGFRAPASRPGDGAIVPPSELSPKRLARHTGALLDKIRTAPDGTKWATLRDVAITLGGYVASGYLSATEAQTMLRGAIETRRGTVASMPAAYQTITEALTYGQSRPLWYTRGDDAQAPAPARRDTLRRQLIAERIAELEAAIEAAPIDAPDFANMIAEYDHLMGAAALGPS